MTAILPEFADCPIEPVGYRMVLGQLPAQKKVGMIDLPDNCDTTTAQELLSSISQVVKQGDLCYEGDHFFSFRERKAMNDGKLIAKGYNPPQRRWCNVGDWVLHGANAGTRLPTEVDGKRVTYRILNDDEFLAVAPDIETLKKMMPILSYSLTT